MENDNISNPEKETVVETEKGEHLKDFFFIVPDISPDCYMDHNET
jgi:hypothetical protein